MSIAGARVIRLGLRGHAGDQVMESRARGFALGGFAAKRRQQSAMFAGKSDYLVGIDIAAFYNGGLHLLDAQLHGGDLLYQRLVSLAGSPPEVRSVGVEQGPIPHGGDGPLIDARQRDPDWLWRGRRLT